MARKWRRILALLILTAMAASVSACANVQRAPWIGGFDRSLSAVMSHFNQLAASWGELRGSDDAPSIPSIGSATFTGDFEFVFLPKEGSEFENECSRFSISGATNQASGKVDRLTLDIDCTLDKVTPGYLTSCDQLLQLALFSLFDSLGEKESRDLSLLFVYDIRPFNPRSLDVSLPDSQKRTECVMAGQLIEFSSSVSDGSHISMRVDFAGGAPTRAQIGQNSENISCNRKLSQANTECTDLRKGMQYLSDILDEGGCNWSEMQAISELFSEFVSVIEELCDLLRQYEKTRTYASRMIVPLTEFKLMNQQFEAHVQQKDIEAISFLCPSMEDSANMMQMLSSMALS